MKYASLLLGLGIFTAGLPAQAATITIANGTFGTGDLTSWTCPIATCTGTTNVATLNNDPYWMRVNSDFVGSNAAHFGAAVANTDWIYQSLSVVNGTKYTVSFSFGEEYPFSNASSGYFSTGSGEFDTYWTTAGWTAAAGPPTTKTASGSANVGRILNDNFASFSNSNPTGPALSGRTVAGSMVVQATSSTMFLGFGGFDVYEDVWVDTITMSSCTACTVTDMSFIAQDYYADGTVSDPYAYTPTSGDEVDLAPEPGTFGLMGIVSLALFAAAKKARSARA